jgi:hypothetical protein
VANISSARHAIEKIAHRRCLVVSLGTMSPVSRGFFGRRQPVDDALRVPPGQYVTRYFPCCPRARSHARRWTSGPSWSARSGGGAGLVDMGRVRCASGGDADGRHPLRDQVDKARPDVEGVSVDTLL